MQFEEKTIERKEIYQGPIFQVVTDQVELPAGKGQAQRDLIFHNGAVAVFPITEDGKTILVKQYRKAIERTSVEIPAGKLEKGENADPQAAALSPDRQTFPAEGHRLQPLANVPKFSIRLRTPLLFLH